MTITNKCYKCTATVIEYDLEVTRVICKECHNSEVTEDLTEKKYILVKGTKNTSIDLNKSSKKQDKDAFPKADRKAAIAATKRKKVDNL